MFSRCLDFGGALHLCFVVSERASEIPLLSYYIMVVFDNVLQFEISYYCSLADVIDMSQYNF